MKVYILKDSDEIRLVAFDRKIIQTICTAFHYLNLKVEEHEVVTDLALDFLNNNGNVI